MRVLRIGLLWALGAAASACSSGGQGIDVSGSWTGTMTDEGGARTVSGNCNHGESARCSFTVTDSALEAVSQATLTGVVTTDATSAEILSYVLSVVPPPCTITVTGDAKVSGRAWEGTYRGMDSCVPGGIVRDGRLSLTRQ